MRTSLFHKVDPTPVVIFRVLFGLVLAWEACRYLTYGWIRDYWVEPQWHFTYAGFDWVRPLSESGLVAVMSCLAVLGLCVATGLFSRVAVVLCGVGWTYFFLLDQMTYLNHMYLICLLCFLVAISPVHASLCLFSSSRRRLVWSAPWWSANLLRYYVAFVYFWAGIAKLNPDWLQAQPMIMWMERRRDTDVIGPLLAHDLTAWALSYGGLFFDLLVGPMLLHRRFRWWIMPFVIAFHLTNALVFSIGVFPWMMIGSCVLFLDAAMIRAFLNRMRFATRLEEGSAVSVGARRLAIGFLCTFGLVQTALPLRHHFYPGSPSWTEEGHLFAWHMKLRSKSATLSYLVVDPDTGERWKIEPREHLSKRQARKIRTRPDLIWLFAQRIADDFREIGRDGVHVYARSRAGLNGRPKQIFIDPDVDLSRAPRSTFRHAPWILPME